jgi:type IX secretion system PorP/SprF family membrane protein
MLKKILKLSIAASAMFFSVKTSAQVDPHFSQYYIYPQWLNPALTGVMDGDYRVAGIYRSQWQNIDNGFKTIGVAAEFATNKDINYGIGIFQQSAGTGGYKFTNPTASISYSGIKLGRLGTHRINIGIQAGMMDKRFDPSKLTFGSTFNNPGNVELLANPQQTYFDLGAGIMYYDATPNKKVNLFGGLSFNHITQPTDKFLHPTSNANPKMPMRQTLHGGARISLSDKFSITPNGLLMQQGTAHERMIGIYGQLVVGEGMDFLGGLNYRFNDAVVPFIGFSYKDFVLGLSYDVTTSQLSQIAGSTNAFEISISFTGRKHRKMDAQPFICPRL